MNAKQVAVIDSLCYDVLNHDGYRADEYEYKEFTVTESPDTNVVFLLTVVGRKNDEGTMGEIFARTTRHFAINERGTVKLLNPGWYNTHTKKIEWSKNPVQGYRQALISLTK